MSNVKAILQFLKNYPFADMDRIAQEMDMDIDYIEQILEKMEDRHLIENVNDGQYVVLNKNDFGVIE